MTKTVKGPTRVETATAIIEKMTLIERADLLEKVEGLLEEAKDGKRVSYARKEAKALSEPRGRGRGRRPKTPFWTKIVEGYDPAGKTPMDKLLGDWAKDMSWVDEGELVLVGLRFPQKRYAIVRKKKGAEVALFKEVRPEFPIELEDVELVEAFEEFRDVMSWVEANVGEGTAESEKEAESDDFEDGGW